MIEMELNKIIIDEKRHDQVVVLKEKKGSRILPIIIGFVEASSIKMRLSGLQPPRPLTHDLIYSIIKGLDAEVEKIVIDKLQDSTFHAKLFLKNNQGRAAIIDARPSDCIAVSVRAKCPVFVDDQVLKLSANLNK